VETGFQEPNRQTSKVYSFNILFITSQSFSKVSMTIFIRTMTPNSLHRFFASLILFGTAVWTTTAVFGLLFQCNTPEVWNFLQNTCINRLAFYTFVEIASIALDACLILLPVMIAWQLQLNLKSKLVIIGCFASRILVIASIIVQLVILYEQNKTSDPFLSWSTIVSTEVILNLGIASACVPYLKPFLQSINSGMIGSEDIRRRGGDSSIYKYVSKTKSYSRRKISNFLSNRTENSVLDSRITDEVFPPNLKGIVLENRPGHVFMNRSNVFATADRGEIPIDWEAGSESSRANFIRQTNTFAVESEHVTG